MTVFVNQKAIEVSEGASIATLVRQLEMQDKPIAVAIGKQIVRRVDWEQTLLCSDNQINIISICKGG